MKSVPSWSISLIALDNYTVRLFIILQKYTHVKSHNIVKKKTNTMALFIKTIHHQLGTDLNITACI